MFNRLPETHDYRMADKYMSSHQAYGIIASHLSSRARGVPSRQSIVQPESCSPDSAVPMQRSEQSIGWRDRAIHVKNSRGQSKHTNIQAHIATYFVPTKIRASDFECLRDDWMKNQL